MTPDEWNAQSEGRLPGLIGLEVTEIGSGFARGRIAVQPQKLYVGTRQEVCAVLTQRKNAESGRDWWLIRGDHLRGHEALLNCAVVRIEHIAVECGGQVCLLKIRQPKIRDSAGPNRTRIEGTVTMPPAFA